MLGFGALGGLALGQSRVAPQDIRGAPPPPAWLAAVVAAWQPGAPTDPRAFIGGRGPYQPRLPLPVGVQVDQPPPSHPARRPAGLAVLVDAWQPPVTPPHVFVGAWEPLAPRRLPAALTGVPKDNPPFEQLARTRVTAAIVDLNQPPSHWPWTFTGGRQPLAPARLTAELLVVKSVSGRYVIPVGHQVHAGRVAPLALNVSWRIVGQYRAADFLGQLDFLGQADLL